MHLPIENKIRPNNFWELYKMEIKPLLQEIDIFIKSIEDNASIAEAADLLYISEDEIKNIMDKQNIYEINRDSFISIMENGSSKICRMFKRELELNSPFAYKRDEIAYIYDLELTDVNCACDILGIKEATSYTLPILFANIPVY